MSEPRERTLHEKLTPERERRNGYPGEWCRRCDRRVAVGFTVPDEVWESIVAGRFHIVCLPCFDELSEGTGVCWEDDIEFWPVSAAGWTREETL